MRQPELLVKAVKLLLDSGREALLPVTNQKAFRRKNGVSMKHRRTSPLAVKIVFALTLPLFLPMCGKWMYGEIKRQDSEERWSDFRGRRKDRTSGEGRMIDKERT